MSWQICAVRAENGAMVHRQHPEQSPQHQVSHKHPSELFSDHPRMLHETVAVIARRRSPHKPTLSCSPSQAMLIPAFRAWLPACQSAFPATLDLLSSVSMRASSRTRTTLDPTLRIPMIPLGNVPLVILVYTDLCSPSLYLLRYLSVRLCCVSLTALWGVKSMRWHKTTVEEILDSISWLRFLQALSHSLYFFVWIIYLICDTSHLFSDYEYLSVILSLFHSLLSRLQNRCTFSLITLFIFYFLFNSFNDT